MGAPCLALCRRGRAATCCKAVSTRTTLLRTDGKLQRMLGTSRRTVSSGVGA
ncbi:hypothetical protein A176_000160 [Myxococcus hansupus]|uniref:Uncharacterized protein n=1 Tax=Pseudomyxococcus hansupus TaxID=1297742 RepID=A0A0H4WNV2_9BACT|nr:hypothetical protein A176_000160 [Myxococcus hansupus]